MESIEENEKKKERLHYIYTAGHALLDQINRILVFAEGGGEMRATEMARCNIHSALSAILARYQTVATGRGLVLTAHVASDVPSEVMCHGPMITKIVEYLTDNAIKFTKTGRVDVYVTIKTKARKRRDGRVMVRVVDTGIGINHDMIPKLFDFYSHCLGGGINYATCGNGIGVGLPMAHRLARLMHGKLWAESVVGQGSTFYLTAKYTV